MLNLLVLSTIALSASPSFVREISVPNVAFSYLLNDKLYLTSFAVFKDDKVFTLPQSGLLNNGTALALNTIPGSITWPNGITPAPKALFGTDGIVVAGGFLTPGKGNGGIWYSPIVNGTQGTFVQLYAGSSYFYHRVEFYDVDGDGKLDILTCRATKPLFGNGKGDLVWLKPKNRAAPTGSWDQFIIGRGCDTHFRLVDVNGDGKLDILSAEFWGKALTLIQSKTGRFNNASDLVYTTIDNTLGSAFDVDFVDVNGDGKLDILATNHESTEANAKVIAYEVPANVTSGKFTRHDIATGFKVLQSGPGQAAPGGALVFKPTPTSLPTIVVAGDGSQQAYLLTPSSTTVSDWTFTRSLLHNCGCTVGFIAVGDTNNDGKSEIYIPCYDNSKLVVYTF